jgi:FAD/FMN-containing dehydrogenase
MNLDALKPHFHGEILTPASAGYDAARRIWNGMIDRRPAAIARCTGPADVVAAVRFAASENVYPAVRAGGHNVAGLASVDDGLVIDVSPMKRIMVDPAARTATAETGLTWGEFDRETQAHGLATTGGLISLTGIAGLTLGGGVGWLMGRCGLTCDNTLAYDLVTADGASITASPDEHPDLFWALKGGGGNFGVVSSITYRLHAVGPVISGMLLHPLARARDVLAFYRNFVTAGLPDELIVYAAAITTPDSVPMIAIIPAWTGRDLDEGERVLAPLRAFGPPAADLVARMPYVAMQQMLDAAAPYGIRSYWKSHFLSALPDAAIDTFVRFAESCTSPRTIMVLEHGHGAVARVAPDATAFPMRGHAFDLVVLSLWEDAEDDARHIAWTRSLYEAMQPWSAALVYVNALSEDDAGRVREAYGANYPRLAEVKAKYDPDNRFRHNQNISARGVGGDVELPRQSERAVHSALRHDDAAPLRHGSSQFRSPDAPRDRT